MALMRCPRCHEIVGDYPDVAATADDGTAVDKFDCFDCFDCVSAELEGYDDSDDAA